MTNKGNLLKAASLAVAAVVVGAHSPSAYVLKPYKWSTLVVPFYVNPQSVRVSPEAAIAAVQFGAAAWTTQTTIPFSFYFAGTTSGSTVTNNGRNEVFFRNASNGSSIATTYTYYSGDQILDTDIVFWEGGFNFFTGDSGCSGGFYVEDIATHEFGHALGLGHSSVSGATMVSGAYYCAIDHRWLAEDDKLGAEYLYGFSSTNTAPVVSISTPANGSSFADGTSISFSGSATDNEEGNLSSTLVWLSSRDGQIGTGTSFEKVLSVGSHTITAWVNDSKGVSGQAQHVVAIEAAAVPSVGTSSFVLAARAYKVKRMQNVELTWSGATSTWIDVYRNGSLVTTTVNDGNETNRINQKGGGTYNYVVCHAGTTTCSNQVTVSF